MTVLDVGFTGVSATRGPSTQQGTARSVRAPHAPSRQLTRPPSLGRLPETAAVSIQSHSARNIVVSIANFLRNFMNGFYISRTLNLTILNRFIILQHDIPPKECVLFYDLDVHCEKSK